MTKLYIANCTRQNQRVFYRLDVDSEGIKAGQIGVLPKHQDIGPGRQEAVGGELAHISQAESIIKQLAVFGLRPAEEVNRLSGITPYLFSTDRPVPRSAIEKAHNHNQAVLAKDGRGRREAAAIAAGNAVQSDEVKVSIEQVTESELGGTSVAEGYTVEKSAAALPKAERQGRKVGRRGRNSLSQ